MSAFDELERQLRGAVREQAAQVPARRRRWRTGRHHKKLVGAALVGLVLAGGGTAIAITASEPRAPQGQVHVEAKVNRAQGPPLGIASYRSQEGKRCFAEGRVIDGQVSSFDGSGGYAAKPLTETAMCLRPGAPVALAMGEDPDNPSHVIVSGLAPPGSTQVQASSSEDRAITRPGDDGSFMVTVAAPLASNVQVRVTRPDGSVTTHTLHSLPAPPPPSAPPPPPAP